MSYGAPMAAVWRVAAALVVGLALLAGTSRAATYDLAAGAGGDHTCVKDVDGNIKCWGANTFGQLGVGGLGNRGDFANEMGDALPWTKIPRADMLSVGDKFNCAVLKPDPSFGSKVVCWGANRYGQLGQGDIAYRGTVPGELGEYLPGVNTGVDPSKIRDMCTAGDHACVLASTGSVQCWGLNKGGQLGVGDELTRGDEPGEMGNALVGVFLGFEAPPVKGVACGGNSTCSLHTDGTVRCWGSNAWGQLGVGDNDDRYDDDAVRDGEIGDNLPPVPLNGRVTKVSVGVNHACALMETGEVKCWGRNSSGQLGTGDQDNRGDSQNSVKGIKAVDLGTRSVYAWPTPPPTAAPTPEAAADADGDATPSPTPRPKPVVTTVTLRAVDVACGAVHTCVALDSGNVKCWGSNTVGQLGLGDTDPRGSKAGEMGDALPYVNFGDFGEDEFGQPEIGPKAVTVAVGKTHSCAQFEDGSVKCWGDSDLGQLGYGDQNVRGHTEPSMGDALPRVELGMTLGAATPAPSAGAGATVPPETAPASVLDSDFLVTFDMVVPLSQTATISTLKWKCENALRALYGLTGSGGVSCDITLSGLATPAPTSAPRTPAPTTAAPAEETPPSTPPPTSSPVSGPSPDLWRQPPTPAPATAAPTAAPTAAADGRRASRRLGQAGLSSNMNVNALLAAVTEDAAVKLRERVDLATGSAVVVELQRQGIPVLAGGTITIGVTTVKYRGAPTPGPSTPPVVAQADTGAAAAVAPAGTPPPAPAGMAGWMVYVFGALGFLAVLVFSAVLYISHLNAKVKLSEVRRGGTLNAIDLGAPGKLEKKRRKRRNLVGPDGVAPPEEGADARGSMDGGTKEKKKRSKKDEKRKKKKSKKSRITPNPKDLVLADGRSLSMSSSASDDVPPPLDEWNMGVAMEDAQSMCAQSSIDEVAARVSWERLRADGTMDAYPEFMQERFAAKQAARRIVGRVVKRQDGERLLDVKVRQTSAGLGLASQVVPMPGRAVRRRDSVPEAGTPPADGAAPALSVRSQSVKDEPQRVQGGLLSFFRRNGKTKKAGAAAGPAEGEGLGGAGAPQRRAIASASEGTGGEGAPQRRALSSASEGTGAVPADGEGASGMSSGSGGAMGVAVTQRVSQGVEAVPDGQAGVRHSGVEAALAPCREVAPEIEPAAENPATEEIIVTPAAEAPRKKKEKKDRGEKKEKDRRQGEAGDRGDENEEAAARRERRERKKAKKEKSMRREKLREEAGEGKGETPLPDPAELERLAAEEQERLAAEKAAAEEQERLAAEKAAAEKAAAEEQERLAAEKAAAEKAAAEEQERLAAEKAAAEEQERLAAEKAAAEEQERLAAEKAAAEKAAAEERAQLLAKKKALEEKLAAEKRALDEKLAAEARLEAERERERCSVTCAIDTGGATLTGAELTPLAEEAKGSEALLVDLGDVATGQRVKRAFHLASSGKEPHGFRLEGGSPDLVFKPAAGVIGPGERVRVEAVFCTDRVGPVVRLPVKCVVDGGRTFVCAVSCHVRAPRVALTFSQHDFGARFLGAAPAKVRLEIRNSDDREVMVECPIKATKSLRVVCPAGILKPAGLTSRGQMRTAEIHFVPTGLGEVDETVVFRINGCAQVPVRFVGRGVDMAVEVEGGDVVDFGDVLVGTEATRRVRVRNAAEIPVELDLREAAEALVLAGVSLRPRRHVEVPPGETTELDLAYHPTVKKAPFEREAIVYASGAKVALFRVRGASLLLAARLSRTGLDLSAVVGGEPAAETVEVLNDGDMDLAVTWDGAGAGGDWSFEPAAGTVPARGGRLAVRVAFRPAHAGENAARRALCVLTAPGVGGAHIAELPLELRGTGTVDAAAELARRRAEQAARLEAEERRIREDQRRIEDERARIEEEIRQLELEDAQRRTDGEEAGAGGAAAAEGIREELAAERQALRGNQEAIQAIVAETSALRLGATGGQASPDTPHGLSTIVRARGSPQAPGRNYEREEELAAEEAAMRAKGRQMERKIRTLEAMLEQHEGGHGVGVEARSPPTPASGDPKPPRRKLSKGKTRSRGQLGEKATPGRAVAHATPADLKAQERAWRVEEAMERRASLRTDGWQDGLRGGGPTPVKSPSRRRAAGTDKKTQEGHKEKILQAYSSRARSGL